MPVRYFAYGTNMAEQVIREWCPTARYVGPAVLPDHQLDFTRRSVKTGTGVADVVPANGSAVWGALYEIEDQELASLDRKEGRGWAYKRAAVDVCVSNGREVTSAFTYRVVSPSGEPVPPSAVYLKSLIAAAEERVLPADYIQMLTRVRCMDS